MCFGRCDRECHDARGAVSGESEIPIVTTPTRTRMSPEDYKNTFQDTPQGGPVGRWSCRADTRCGRPSKGEARPNRAVDPS